MSVQYEVTVITGKYTDAQGNEKNRYAKLGVVIEGKNGPMLKLETVPLGWDGWAYLNEPREREAAPKRQGQQRKPAQHADASNGDPFGDDIPFSSIPRRQLW